MLQTIKINKTVRCDGSSLWGDTKNLPVKVKWIDFEDDTFEKYILLWVKHDCDWTIYTDEGFEKAISKILSDKVGKRIKIVFTEQGMQENCYASMEFSSKAGEASFRKFFYKKVK